MCRIKTWFYIFHSCSRVGGLIYGPVDRWMHMKPMIGSKSFCPASFFCNVCRRRERKAYLMTQRTNIYTAFPKSLVDCLITVILWTGIPQALASLTIVAISCDRSQAARILVNRPSSTDMTKKILRIWIIAVLTTIPRGFLYRYTPDVETSVLAYKCSAVRNTIRISFYWLN